MTRPRTSQVETAKQLLASEGAPWSSREECAAAVWRVYEKLNARLAPLLGAAGVQTLFVRSAKLSQPDFPCFKELDTAEGLTKLGSCLRSLDPAIAADAAAALFGTLIELIATLVGERLTFLVLRSAWPSIERTAREEPQADTPRGGESTNNDG